MPASKTGKRYILTIMDNFSRWLYCHPTVRDRAEDAVDGVIAFILENGIPDTIESDRGVHFVNHLFAGFCEKFKISQQIHCAYRPQSSGALERVHRTIKNTLFILVNDLSIDWPEALMYARYAHNVAFNCATKCSPFFTVFGRDPNITQLENSKNWNNSPVDNGKRVATVLEKAHAAIKISQSEADLKFENRVNPKFEIINIDLGDDIYLKRAQSVAAKGTHMNWVGPFRVTKSNGSIIEIQKDCPDGPKDYVHRSHVVKVVNRDDHLKAKVVLPYANNVNYFKTRGDALINDFENNLPLNYKKALLTPRTTVPSEGHTVLGRTRAQTKKLQPQQEEPPVAEEASKNFNLM
jgi:hypothetical protein